MQTISFAATVTLSFVWVTLQCSCVNIAVVFIGSLIWIWRDNFKTWERESI